MTNNLEHSSMVLEAITSDELITTIEYTAPRVSSIKTRDIHFNTVNKKSGKMASRLALFSVVALVAAGTAFLARI